MKGIGLNSFYANTTLIETAPNFPSWITREEAEWSTPLQESMQTSQECPLSEINVEPEQTVLKLQYSNYSWILEKIKIQNRFDVRNREI